MNRTLDYVPRLDPRNKQYRVHPVGTDLLTARWWTGGTVLDQGFEGTCVGHGVVGEYLASPVRGSLGDGLSELGRQIQGHKLAVDVFDRCAQIDEFEGASREDGTSVRAGMLVHRERGWSTGFRWAFNRVELRSALEEGPVVIGFEVFESMYDTKPNGDWVPAGRSVGWHCALLTGYSPNYNRRGPRYRIRNSWGQDWGLSGNAYISTDDLNRILFQAGGEAAVPVGRKA